MVKFLALLSEAFGGYDRSTWILFYNKEDFRPFKKHCKIVRQFDGDILPLDVTPIKHNEPKLEMDEKKMKDGDNGSTDGSEEEKVEEVPPEVVEKIIEPVVEEAPPEEVVDQDVVAPSSTEEESTEEAVEEPEFDRCEVCGGDLNKHSHDEEPEVELEANVKVEVELDEERPLKEGEEKLER